MRDFGQLDEEKTAPVAQDMWDLALELERG